MARSLSTIWFSAVWALCLMSACAHEQADHEQAEELAPVGDAGFGTLPTATGPPTSQRSEAACFVDAHCPAATGPCSKSACIDGACSAVHMEASCDDGDPCTESDQCAAGLCQGSPVVCDDGVACTNDYCWGEGCTSVPSKEAHCALKVVVLEPSRGATVLGNDSVTVSGYVTSPAGPVASLTVDGVEVPVGMNGSFTTELAAARGINVLVVEAVDGFDRTDRALQAFTYGESVHAPGTSLAPTMIDEGIGLWLDKTFFDDDAADLDDVAALTSHILQGYDLNAALPHPLFPPGQEPQIAFCTWSVDLTDVEHTVGPIDIQPVDGGLSLSLELVDLAGWLEADSYACPDAAGHVFIDSVQVDVVASVGMAFQSGLTVAAESVDVSVSGLNIQLEEQSSVFNGAVDWVESEIEVLVAQELQTQIPAMVLPMIQGLMDGITGYQSVVEIDSPMPQGAPLPVTFRVEPGDLTFSDTGAVLSLRMGIGALKGTTHPSQGSIVLGACDVSQAGQEALCCGTSAGAGCVQATCESCVCAADSYCCDNQWDALCAQEAAAGCDASCGCSAAGDAALTLNMDQPVEGFLSEDVVNQLLFAMWWGGQMNMDLGGESLGSAVDGVDVSNVQIQIDPLMPPVVTTCTESGALELQLGDVLANATFDLNGNPASFSLYTSARIALGVAVVPTPGGAGELAIEPQGISLFDYQIVTTDGLGAIGEIVIDGMMETLLEDYLVDDLVVGLAKAYPIPVVDLSPWLSGVSNDMDLTLVPQEVTWESGHLHLGGQVQEP